MNKLKYLIVILCLFVTTNVHAEVDSTITTGVPSTTSTTITSSTRPKSNSSSSYSSFNSSTIKTKDVEGTSHKIFIDDQQELLSEEQEVSLFKDMEKLAPYGNIGFLSISNSSYSETTLAEYYYVANFGQTDGILFMINMGTRQITLRAFSTQAGVDLISSNKVDSILANVYRYAHNGDYYRTAKVAFNQTYTVISGNAIFEPMKMASNAIIAFSISSFILYIYVLGSSSIKKASNKEIINNIKKEALIKDIIIKDNGIRRVYSPQSSGSSGGGGGHSGGGGGGGFHSSGGSHGF